MGAFVCYPEGFTIVDAAAQATAPASNMGWDEPGLVYRSSTVPPYFTVLSQCPTPIDTVALVGTNLRNRDTVRIRIGASQAEVEGTAPVDITMPAWSGPKADLSKAMTILRLPAPVQGKYVRVDITATSHPDGFVQIGRLVIGSSATNSFGAIGQDAEMSINDGSESYDFRGATGWDKYAKTQTFKAPFSHISEVQYRRDWFPLLSKAGNSSAVLMVPAYELKTNPNLLRDSANFLTGWGSSGAVSWVRNADYAHDGSLTAVIMEDADPTGAVGNYYQNVTIPSDNLTYTVSAFVKKSDGPPVRVAIDLAGAEGVNSITTFVTVNPATGATNFAGNSNVVDAGDYWRVWRPLTNSVGHTNVRIRIYPAITTPAGALTGSSPAGVVKNSISGPQIEMGSEMTDWAPTSSAIANDTHYGAFQQADAVFGYISKASPKWSAPYYWNIELTVTSTSL